MSESLLAVFDRICIINLPERSDRRRAVTRELAKQGLAVDGQRVRFTAATRPAEAGEFPSIGARGCFMSHLQTLEQACRDGVQRLLVLEDDVMFARAMAHAAPPLGESIRGSGWHLAYPGHCLEAAAGPLRWIRSEQPLVCAHCYAVSGLALPLLISHLQACLERPRGHSLGSPMHYDGALSLLRRQRPDLVTLVTSRSLAGQRSSRSDIIGPSWLDRWSAPGVAALARGLRNHWRRLADSL
jgi:hypothetical protein